MQNLCEATLRQALCVPRLACSQKVSVRYGRKPSWLGFAKSKEFRVPQPLNWPKNEDEEMYLLTQHHDTYMNSLGAFQRKEYERFVEESKAHASQISEDAEIGDIIKEIERDNEIVRSIREKALIQEWKAVEETITRERTLYEEAELRANIVTEQELKFHMERLKTAIKADTLDEAIEKALSTSVDYNFALDKTGNFYYGRLNSDTPTEKQDLSSATS